MEVTESSAIISSCGLYRYVLQRRWGAGTQCLFVGLNPSTADGSTDDATTRKCISLASSWGFSGMTIANLFAVRCRHPQILSTHRDPIGPENDRFLLPAIEQSHTLVAMWGNHGLKSYGLSARRDQCILSLSNDWQCVGITQQGAPRHPLYVTNRSRLMKFPAGLRESTKRRRLSAYT